MRSWFLLLLVLLPGAAVAERLDAILERGLLRVGVGEFPPWTRRTADGALEGFEIDVGRRLAEDLGVEVEFVLEASIPPLLEAVTAGRVDVVAAGLAVLPERALRVAYSRPYASAGTTLAIDRRLAGRLTGLADLDVPERRVTAVGGTFAETVARRRLPSARLVSAASAADAEAALLNDDVDAYLATDVALRAFALEHAERVLLPMDTPLVVTATAFATARGEHDWLRFLDAWIVARQADGWLEGRRHAWFDGGTPRLAD